MFKNSFNSLALAAVVAVAASFADTNEAQADHCRGYGGYGYGSGVAYYGSPYRANYRYAAPRVRYSTPYYPRYRSGYGGYGGYGYRGYGPGFGYGSPYYGRGSSVGFGPRGVSIGFGF